MNYIIFILSLSLSTYASLPYEYGASSSLIATNGITNFDDTDAANAHALGALLASNKSNLFSVNLNTIIFDLKKFDNILIASEINNASNTDIYGSHDPGPSDSYLLSFHGSFKLFKSLPGKINLSLYTPVDKIAEVRTGDPYLPEYPIYNKLERFMFEFNYAVAFESFSMGLGAMGGIQSKGETFVVAKEGGSTTTSSAEIAQNATPSLSMNFSLLKEIRNFSMFFKFQDEVKSEIENDLDSFIFSGGNIDINWQLNSLMFYDPRAYELGAALKLNKLKVFGSLEYQDWSGFESPRLNLKNTGGILISSDTEKNYESKNILIPTVALSHEYKNYELTYSFRYNPSPLELFDDRNGNVIDLDRSILAFGLKRAFKIDSDSFNFSFAVQYHHLHSKKINKSGNRENGDAGEEKIGSGGYEAKGRIIATSFGINWLL